MFTDNNIPQNFNELIQEIRQYILLQKEYTKLELTEKLTVLLSFLILILLVIILGMVALFYFSFAIAYVIAPAVGGLKISFTLIGCFCLLLITAIYVFRKKIIIDPMTRFLANLFINDSK